jgi:hypothetical protein
MSAGTETHRQPGKTSRQLDAIIAGSAGAALIALSNNAHAENGAGFGPLGALSFFITGVVAKVSGKFLICAEMYVKSSSIGDPIQFQLVRDSGLPGELLIGPAQIQDAGPGGADASAAISWIDPAAVGSTHSYGIRATNTVGGHTVTVPAPAEVAVTLVELPG